MGRLAVLVASSAALPGGLPAFVPVQPEIFGEAHALTSAFADVDGDLDAADSLLRHADHGVQCVDSDRDGCHRMFRNELMRKAAARSIQVQLLDRAGRATRASAEVRLDAADGALLGARPVLTGDGYGPQGLGA